MLFLMGVALNSGGGDSFTVLHGGARTFSYGFFTHEKFFMFTGVFPICLVISETKFRRNQTKKSRLFFEKKTDFFYHP
jgi:hypothetical protein